MTKTKPHPPTQTKERRKRIKPLPQPLSLERGVICSPIVFYLLSISKAFYSPLLGEGLGERLYPLSPFFCLGWGRGFILFLLSFVWVGGRGFLAPFIHVLFNSVPMLPNFHKKAKASLRQVLSLIYFPRKICNFAAINPLINEQRME